MVHTPIMSSQESIQVPLDSLGQWKKTRAKMPQQCAEDALKQALPKENTLCQQEHAKAKVTMALYQAYAQQPVTEKQITVAQNPMGLFSTAKITKKNGLKLVPLGQIIAKKPCSLTKNNKLAIQFDSFQMVIQPFKQVQDFDNPEQGCIVPFFWCKPSEDPELVNMVWDTMKVDGITIPILSNVVAIEKGTQLHYLKDEPEAEEGGQEGIENGPDSHQAKRLKKSSSRGGQRANRWWTLQIGRGWHFVAAKTLAFQASYPVRAKSWS